MTAQKFGIKVYFKSGFIVKLDETYPIHAKAEKAASDYMRDWRDPCQTGDKITMIAIIDEIALENAKRFIPEAA